MINLYSDQVIFRMQRMGGVSVYCAELMARALDDPDVSLTILGAQDEPDNEAWDSYGLNRTLTAPERFNNLLLQRMTVAKLPKNAAHTCVFHGSYFRTADGTKNVLTVHDCTHQRFLKGRSRFMNDVLKSKCIANTDVIVCISESTKRDLLEFYPDANRKRIEVIYNGASDDYRPLEEHELMGRLAQLGSEPYLLYVGARTSYKNFRFMAKLADRLSGIRIVVAGGKPLEPQELDLFGESANRVLHFGGLTNKELNLLYNNAVALVYPSLYEGFGIPILEAMKAGCPVIAFNNSSIPEVLGDTGFLLENNDINGAADACKALVNDLTLRERVTSKEVARSEQFSWDACYQQLKKIYGELAEI